MDGTALMAAAVKTEIEGEEEFATRHIGLSPSDMESMLSCVGQEDLSGLVEAIVPPSIRLKGDLALGEPTGEARALVQLAGLASRNKVFRSFIGMGYHGTRLPYVIERNVLQNPAWYSAYTPYQAEISQGRLEALLNFQTLVCELTAMPVANASLLDEATAAAEAMMMSRRCAKSSSSLFFVADDCHPQTIAVLRTRAPLVGIELKIAAASSATDFDAFGYLFQYPGTTGQLRSGQAAEIAGFAEIAHSKGALIAVAADPLALTLLVPPGEFGADIVIGSAQRFGIPLGFGGPHAAFMSCREPLKRALPGRVVGVSIDSQGAPALRLALQTREQHIRREKATSNICTAQALLAILAGFYAIYHGPDGLVRIARRIHRQATVLAAGLRDAGFSVSEYFFDSIVVGGVDAEAVHKAARQRSINLRELGSDSVGIAFGETVTRSDLVDLWSIFGMAARSEEIDRITPDALPPDLLRGSPVLTHEVFSRYRSETAMLRYLRQLSDRDLALDRTMIPLGSCTMKLNATAEMIPISWAGFSDIHPYAPESQTQGYQHLIKSLECWLAECAGYDAVSLQPNSGAQGELAGLLAIRAWHRANGEGHRDVCLIPESAHGTNPASAHLAGLQVVPVSCDSGGNVDVTDLEAKAADHAARLAALMITYPSTHGVFEESISLICQIVHRFGGQVYTDGANLNALVGLAAPGRFGSDVSHLNLHKTFCIPHGGGGPGIGPVAVKAHLAQFLPGRIHESTPVGPISAAPHGSASLLPIVWMYITMMGARGLRRATCTALLSANYVARRLAPHFPILYAGRSGYVAHECIIDLRPLKETSEVTAEDVAKRLMDYGFHAPTLSFPVPGTLMIEPTESEPKSELDRFVDAMIEIRSEIREIEIGRMERADNPLKNAPHTAAMIASDDWPHPYSRRQAAFPPGVDPRVKVWPATARIDNVHGDRNLMCTCPPLSAYEGIPDEYQ